jgi:hypothetical protein
MAEDRMAVIAHSGARLLVERLRLPSHRGCLFLRRAGALATSRSVVAKIIALMTAALDGTSDAHSRNDLDRAAAA